MPFNSPRFLFRRYELIRRVMGGDEFLEIGPGNLALAVELLTHFRRGTLIEFNDVDARPIYEGLAPEHKQRLQLIIADFLELDLKGRIFDCVLACDVLEHVEDDMRFLRQARKCLRAGGQLIISVPARQKFWSTDDEIVGHFRRYERADLRAKLAEVGYSSIQLVSYGYPFQNIIRLARIALARAQYREKGAWDRRLQTEQSGFMLKNERGLRALGILVNKYTTYPLSLLASPFKGMDLGEGYVATAVRP